MKYAILQSSLEIPDVEKLKRAFRAIPTLTDVDAHILANDAFGILVKGKSAEHAARLSQALRTEGIENEIVAENLLPEMPPGKFVRKLECTSSALILHDPLGRPFPLPWEHIMLIAAGNVRVQEFNQIRTQKQVTRFTGSGDPYQTTETDYATKEESRFQFQLEIVLTKGVLRYSVSVDKAMLFTFLGGDFSPSLQESFGRLLRKLVQFAPHAALNRGAYFLQKNAADIFSYPSKNAFNEEIIWLLWKIKRANS